VTVVFAAAMQAFALVLVFKYGLSQTYLVDVVASRNIFWRFPEFLTGVLAARLLYGGHLRGSRTRPRATSSSPRASPRSPSSTPPPGRPGTSMSSSCDSSG
jgi:hypothetical protein